MNVTVNISDGAKSPCERTLAGSAVGSPRAVSWLRRGRSSNRRTARRASRSAGVTTRPGSGWPSPGRPWPRNRGERQSSRSQGPGRSHGDSGVGCGESHWGYCILRVYVPVKPAIRHRETDSETRLVRESGGHFQTRDVGRDRGGGLGSFVVPDQPARGGVVVVTDRNRRRALVHSLEEQPEWIGWSSGSGGRHNELVETIDLGRTVRRRQGFGPDLISAPVPGE